MIGFNCCTSIVLIITAPPKKSFFCQIRRKMLSITDNSLASTCPNSSIRTISTLLSNLIRCPSRRSLRMDCSAACEGAKWSFVVSLNRKCRSYSAMAAPRLPISVVDNGNSPWERQYKPASCIAVFLPTPAAPTKQTDLVFTFVACL